LEGSTRKSNVRNIVFFMAIAKMPIVVNGVTTAAVKPVSANVPVSNDDILDSDEEKGKGTGSRKLR
jgi:hypothetical protein